METPLVPLSEAALLLKRGISPKYAEEGVLVVNQRCVRGGRLLLDVARRSDPDRRRVPDDRLLQRWDVLVNSTGVGTLGRVAQLSALPQEPTTVDSHVTIVRPDLSRFDGRFFGYVLRDRESEIEAMGEGATGQTELSRTRLGAQVFVPELPMENQQRLASILAAYDGLIENNLRRIEILEELAQALYREWFVSLRFPGHEDVEMVDSSLGPIPRGWVVSDLGSSAQWYSGGTPKTAVAEYWGGPVPWITSGSLTSFLLDRSERTLTDAGVEAGSRLVPRDTLLFVVRGMSLATEFRHGIAEVPLAFGQDCKALIAHAPLEPLYLAHSVSAQAAEIQGMVEFAAHGTGKLSTDRLKALPVIHPPTDLQASFVGLVSPMRELVSNLRTQIDSLRSTRDLLLPRLVSGEIDVSELEIDTEWLVA